MHASSLRRMIRAFYYNRTCRGRFVVARLFRGGGLPRRPENLRVWRHGLQQLFAPARFPAAPGV